MGPSAPGGAAAAAAAASTALPFVRRRMRSSTLIGPPPSAAVPLSGTLCSLVRSPAARSRRALRARGDPQVLVVGRDLERQLLVAHRATDRALGQDVEALDLLDTVLGRGDDVAV